MTGDRTLIDPWSGRLMTAKEAAEACRAQARLQSGFRASIRQRWVRLRTGVREPTPAMLYDRAEWVETL